MSAIASDIVAEAQRLLGAAEEAGVPLRALGGVAVSLRTPEVPAPLMRAFGDLDFAAARGSSREVRSLLEDAGYAPDEAFNTLHGQRRLIYLDAANARKLDVFVGEFSMCHKVPLDRIELEPLTLPLAELLLTKLQIVELNEKDVQDVLALLQGHDIAEADGETISMARVAELCAADWGLWRTFTANVAECRDRAGGYDLEDVVHARVAERADHLLTRIEEEPKSRGWKLRARVGERVRWYELPEEV
ncbi:MAG TPA: nucleotidyltransferase family protein [Gaiellaceae bacterium]|nr:nucleotidyltransferase family protein [Gaiellaceae bacterium]